MHSKTPCQEGYCSDRSEQSVKVKGTNDGTKRYEKKSVTAKSLILLAGGVAERLKAAVC